MKICICGGGALGHACTAVLGSREGVEANVLTRHPERWKQEVEAEDGQGRVFRAPIRKKSSDPAEVIPGCDIVLLCLPGFAIEATLEAIKPHVGQAMVGSIVASTGFFFFAHQILGHGARLFGFQRSPFIARTAAYGQSVRLLGYKPQVAVAVENIADREGFRQTVETLWITPCRLLSGYHEACLTNSNPILHTGRLYSMWKGWKGEAFARRPYFYREWTDDASRTILEMDAEFQTLLEACPVSPHAIPPLLEYYECSDAEGLTRKIRGIPAFRDIAAPMKQTAGGWVPDLDSRYFTEDFPFGLRFIWQLAHEKGVAVPTIDKVYGWGINLRTKQI